MGATIERTHNEDALRRTAEITLAALLQDIGKIFQRADWPLSQAAEQLQDDLCPMADGRPVHRHVLWTYDFCSDSLKWLAEYLDLARVIRLATGGHKGVGDDPAGLVLDAADRLAGGGGDVEVEELQPVIPSQVPLESILWEITAQISPTEGQAGPETRRRRRQQTEAAPATETAGQAPTGGQISSESQGLAQHSGLAEGRVAGEGEPSVPTAEPAAPPGAAAPGWHGFAPTRKGYVKAQLLHADEQILPSPKRPEMGEQDYRVIGTELVAVFQKIGRMSVRPRIEWLIEALRGALEQCVSLVPQYVGNAGQTVSLYSHAAAAAAIAAALWQWYEQTGRLPGADQRPLSLIGVRIDGVDEFLCRPAAGEASSRVCRGRAAFVRLASRVMGDALLRELGLPSVSRLWEGDDGLAILADGSDATAAAVQRFARQQERNLFEQTGGYLKLVVAEPVRFSTEQLRGAGWSGIAGALRAHLRDVRSGPAVGLLQEAGAWRQDAAVLMLKDRHGQPQETGEWVRLQEAYERQFGTSLARGKTIAAYNSPVTPAGSEGEATAIGPWFLHVGVGAEGLVGWEGLEQIYSLGPGDEPWAWLPVWQGLPHGPTFRRADESQLRADPSPQRQQLGGPARRRDTPVNFEELGWLARRSRKGRGFVGRSWLGCLRLEADGLAEGGCGELIGLCQSLSHAVEAARQASRFWQEFVESQLHRADRATWRVFVLRCGLGTATWVGPWNTMMVLAGRCEQWWRRWIGSMGAWPLRGALVFGARDAPVADLVWQAEARLAEADPANGVARIWVFDRARTWTGYREAVRLGMLLDEQIQSPELLAGQRGLTFCRRLLAHERQARAVAGPKQARAGRCAVAWRAALAQDVRNLLLKYLPRRGKRAPGQDELLAQLQELITAGRRGRLPGAVGIAARMVLWQNQGE